MRGIDAEFNSASIPHIDFGKLEKVREIRTKTVGGLFWPGILWGLVFWGLVRPRLSPASRVVRN